MPLFRSISTGLVLSGLLALAASHAADKKDDEKIFTKQLMKKYHKGDDAFVKKVSKGEATNEEVARLLADYKTMAKQTPSKGEAASWKEKTTALVAATEKLAKDAKDPAALADFKKAVNCKACHQAHRPD